MKIYLLIGLLLICPSFGLAQINNPGSGSGSGIPYGIATGTGQAALVTTTGNWSGATQPCTGCWVSWLPPANNTAAGPTLAINGGSPITITKHGAGAVLAGDLQSGYWASAQFDGTELVLENPLTEASGGLPLTGGTANNYTLTISPPITAYNKGMIYHAQFNVANTGASVINISGLGNRNLTKCGTTALVANDINTTTDYFFDDDGTELQLLNPQAATCGSSSGAGPYASGTAVLGTSAISSGTCASVVTVAATGVTTTSNLMADFNADPTAVTGYSPSANGMLSIIKYPTAGNVNFKVCNNTGGSITPGAITLDWSVNPTIFAIGTAALGTGAVSSGVCATVVTVAATGILTTDNIMADFNADPTSTTGYSPSANGMLTIIKYPTSGNVNFKVCNNTAASITPGAVTLNWKVVR